jgi:hypothetical protein
LDSQPTPSPCITLAAIRIRPGADHPRSLHWIGALELAQQPVAALDRGIQRGLRGLLAAERLSRQAWLRWLAEC